jgi:4-aminobutyrate aminotransferase/(S)-3-amino-2-methylpropionate transaminase
MQRRSYAVVRKAFARDVQHNERRGIATTVTEAFFPNEPKFPTVKTSIPGPKTTALIDELKEVFDTQSLNMMANYQKSVGNYIVDEDGNELLDVYAQIASIPVGYNNSNLAKAAKSEQMISALINRPALGNFPPHDWSATLRSTLLKVAPRGHDQVLTSMSGSDANELAYKAAFMWKRDQQRGRGVDFTDAELKSSMLNQSPGASNMSILSFEKGFHGRLFGSLSTTRSKPIHKIDIPAFDWPCAPFPELKYPLDQYASDNAAHEMRCLEETERILSTFHSPPAAMIIEPVQSEGGDNHASPTFFRALQQMAKKHQILFIIDEVQTGVGATGRFWAHEHWDLPQAPDIVTFSKKAQAAGFFYSDSGLRPAKAYRQFNTWMGDPSRALLFGAIWEEIERLDLIQNTAKVGDYLYSNIAQLQQQHPGQIHNLRGKGMGTFIAFDTPKRDALLKQAKSLGVNLGGSGANAVRLRPMLVFQKHHADILLERLEKLLQ